MKRDSGPPQIYFDHVPKTGGTSLHALLRSAYGVSAITPKLATYGFAEARRRYPAARIVSGHIRIMPGDRVPEDWLSITVLRDPVDRIVSEFFYRKHDASSVSAGTLAASAATFDEYVAAGGDGTIELANFQAKHFALYTGQPEGSRDEETLLRDAIAALDRFTVVGTSDELQDLVDAVGWMLSWAEPLQLARENRTSRRPLVAEIEAPTLERLQEANRVDAELCAYARRRLRRTLATCLRSSYGRSSAGRGDAIDPSAAGPGDRTPVPLPGEPREERERREFGDRAIEIVDVAIVGPVSPRSTLLSGETASVHVVLRSSIACDDVTVGMQLRDETGAMAFGTNSRLLGYTLDFAQGGTYTAIFTFANALGLGRYELTAAVHTGHSHLNRCFHWLAPAAVVEVVGNIGEGFEGRTKLRPHLSVHAPDGRPVMRELALSEQRLCVPNEPLECFHGRLRLLAAPGALSQGESVSIALEIGNDGGMPWPAGGQRPVRVSYHWLDESGAMLIHEGERTPIPRDLPSGESARVWATVVAPRAPAPRWMLRMTLVQEGVAWFDERGPAFVEAWVSCHGYSPTHPGSR